MDLSSSNRDFTQVPITNIPRSAYRYSTIAAFLMTAVSLGGLVMPSVFYPAEALRRTFLPNDLVNLVVGVPVLLACLWLSRAGKLAGLLCWPGALLYVLYNYIAYIFGVPFVMFKITYFALVLLSAGVMILLFVRIERETIAEQLSGVVPVKAGGWILVVFGVAFFSRAIGVIVTAGSDHGVLPGSEVGVLIADMILSFLWILGGILLVRREPLGYISGLGLLFVGCMLFIGLIMFFVLQPLFTNAVFALVDVIAVAVMSLFCFIPFLLFIRGVGSKQYR